MVRALARHRAMGWYGSCAARKEGLPLWAGHRWPFAKGPGPSVEPGWFLRMLGLSRVWGQCCRGQAYPHSSPSCSHLMAKG